MTVTLNRSSLKPSILGKGLSALLSADDAYDDVDVGGNSREAGGGILEVAVLEIAPNPNQPRRVFNKEEISDLANSIQEKGILQPLLVKIAGVGSSAKYEIIAGERRWRAAKEAGIKAVPVIIKDYSEFETLEVAIIENIQRENLSAIEEATAYQQLMDKFGYTLDRVSEKVGKSKSHIGNLVRLLSLPEEVKMMVSDGSLSMGHARAIISSEDPVAYAHTIIQQKLSVREAERLGRKVAPKVNPEGEETKALPASDLGEITAAMAATLRMAVKIVPRGQGGQLILEYKNFEQLDMLMQKLGS